MQEIQVTIKLTLSVDDTLSKEDMRVRLEDDLKQNIPHSSIFFPNGSYYEDDRDMDFVSLDLLEIKEEYEIYRTEEQEEINFIDNK